jgi:hypothetical protein
MVFFPDITIQRRLAAAGNQEVAKLVELIKHFLVSAIIALFK